MNLLWKRIAKETSIVAKAEAVIEVYLDPIDVKYTLDDIFKNDSLDMGSKKEAFHNELIELVTSQENDSKIQIKNSSGWTIDPSIEDQVFNEYQESILDEKQQGSEYLQDNSEKRGINPESSSGGFSPSTSNPQSIVSEEPMF